MELRQLRISLARGCQRGPFGVRMPFCCGLEGAGPVWICKTEHILYEKSQD
jgi:hypothetical protein